MNANKNVPTLQKQFIQTFSYPMIIVAFISIVMTVVFMNVYRQALVNRKEILTMIEEITQEKAKPIAQLAIKEVQVCFQRYIDNLVTIRNGYLSNRKRLRERSSDSDDKWSHWYVNGLDHYEPGSGDHGEFIYDKARWFVSPSLTDFELLKKNQKDRMFEVMSTFDLLKAVIELSPQSDRVVFTFDNAELYVDYPFHKASSKEEFERYTHDNKCRNNQDEFPEYYYFRCRPYYLSITSLPISTKEDIAITNKYTFPNGKEGLSACIRFLIEKGTSEEETVVLCEDFNITSIITNLDHYNNLINGYFFITQGTSLIPLYYPNTNEANDKSDFIELEFDLLSQFYLDEITEYSSTTSSSPSSEPNRLINKKNGKAYQYSLFPIVITSQTASDAKAEMNFTLFYVNPNGLDYKLKIDTTEITVIITIFFFIMEFVMILVSQYSIVSIAHTVVKPIKNIKGLLEKMDSNTELGDSTAYQLNTSSEGRSSFEKRKSQPAPEEEEDDEQDDKIITTRSKNLQMLFVKLVDLKNSFRVIQEISTKTFTLPLLAHALDTFDKITNESASRICNSNMSNLFLNLETYDKSISHLNDVLKPLYSKIIQLKGDSLEQAKKLIKNEYVPLRYLKLFYCYKKHFKGIRDQTHQNEQAKLLNFQLIISHPEEEYAQHVGNFVLLMNHVQDYRNIYNALLEKIEWIIVYQMKKDLFMDQKLSSVREVFNLFKTLEEIKDTKDLREYSKTSKDNVLMTDIEILNSIDIPISVMLQRTHYLKAKFYLKCSNYIKAVEYFNQAVHFNNIGNKTIVISSLNKLNRIATIYSRWIIAELDFHNRERRLKHLVQEDQKNRAQVEAFIGKNHHELARYQSKPKDVCFIINSRLFAKQGENAALLSDIVDIFNTNINNEDNCCILLYHDNDFKILMTLTKKTAENSRSIEALILSYAKMSYSEEERVNRSSVEVDPGLIGKIIKYSLAFMNKKKLALDTLRESWYIYVTKDSPRMIFEVLKRKRLRDYYNNAPEHNMILFIYDNGTLKEEDIELIDKLIQYNKSAVICRNNLNKLNSLMGVCAKEQQNLFQLEKFIESN